MLGLYVCDILYRNRNKTYVRKVGLLSSDEVKMQLNYYISPRLEKRGPTISEYSEVYCLVKMSESENI